jgi:hypothetical protein
MPNSPIFFDYISLKGECKGYSGEGVLPWLANCKARAFLGRNYEKRLG